MLDSITEWEKVNWRRDGKPVERDPTWGFFFFLTDYAQATMDNISLALENLIKVQQRRLKVNTEGANLFANEVYRRLRFDVV